MQQFMGVICVISCTMLVAKIAFYMLCDIYFEVKKEEVKRNKYKYSERANEKEYSKMAR